jgi:signal transduction histidine kinase/ligand-binding sensor domain-containing protein/DNA-binding response OmpR family regulator
MGLTTTQAQENSNFHFKKYQVGDGLSENAVYSILQDTDGFMWFGTKDGLNRFDGSNFRHYQYKVGEKTSIGNNFIRCLAQKNKEHFYIGTDAGLYIMNIKNETFKRISLKTSDNIEINSAINSLLVDSKGILWIGTMSQGIFMHSPKENRLTQVATDNIDLGLNATWSIIEDQSGIVWAGTRLGLLRYNAQSQRFESIKNLFSQTENAENEVLSILEDKIGNLWLGTWANGLRCYNKQSGEFTSYLNIPSANLYVTHIRSIFQYTETSLLIGSDDGLYLFNIESKIAKRVDIPQYKYSLSDQNVYSIARDKEGGIWIGTYFGGVNYLNTSLLSIETYYPDVLHGFLSGKAVSQFCEDKLGNLWIATEDGGINYFNVKSKLITQPIKTTYHNTHALLLDGDDLWIGTFSRGLDIYNTKTKRLTNYRFNAGNLNTINDDCIFSIYRTKSGDIYVGTPIGLNKYDRVGKKFIRIPQITGFIYDMKEDDAGNLWLASYGTGAIKFNAQTKKWVKYDKIKDANNPIVRSKLTSIYIDSQRRIIFSSEGRGIFIYNRKTDDFENISEADGLPNDVIYGILDDPSGNLWLSSNKGLICFNVKKPKEYKLYNIEDGLQSNQFNFKASYKTRDGKFYFGGINGFNSFYPQELNKLRNQITPPVAITKISILSNNDTELEKEIQTKLNNKQSIKLNYDKSSFTISFVSLSFISQSKNQYAYKLQGVDADWNLAGNNKNVTYVNLPPGKYTFKVKASNNDGLWNDEGSEIEIEILPPFWLSGIAKIFYALLVYYIDRNKTRQKRHLEAFKAEQETKSFKSKIEFFTTIAHEIRTPLSLISAPLEEIIAVHEGSEQTKVNLSIIEKNRDRLSVLINQLLDFRKMDSTEYIIHPENINLREYLQELYERFKKTAQRKDIDFNLILPKQGELSVLSDSDALTKIVGNLLTNALKFAYSKIIFKLAKNKDNSYTISVEDDGSGIPDDLKNLIFDPFYQIQSAKENIGTGIGLSLVKHLTAVLNAKIEVSDAKKGGAVFAFTFSDLPVVLKEEAKETELKNTEDFFSINSEITEDAILVIDDNPDMTEFIKNCLSADYLVDTAKDAPEGLQQLEEKNYHLIISDIMMPGVDGISLVKTLKADVNYSHIPVILLSAKVENSTKVEGLKSGADVFMEKPFSTLHLKAQIASLLKNRKSLQELFNRSPLASYSSLATNKSDDYFLKKLNDEIEKHISDENFTVESLTDILNISRSNLQRKLKGISGYSPGDYLRNYRLKKACKLLLESDSRINEVAFSVGFNSASYFTKAFYKCYHMSPKEFVNYHLKNGKKIREI